MVPVSTELAWQLSVLRKNGSVHYLISAKYLKGGRVNLGQYFGYIPTPEARFPFAIPIQLGLNSLRPSDAYICVSKLAIIGSDNGLSPGWRQAIIWTNDGILLIGHLGTNFNEILIEIYKFYFKKMHLKLSSGSWRPFCLGLNVF